jgi:hypothetical protein
MSSQLDLARHSLRHTDLVDWEDSLWTTPQPRRLAQETLDNVIRLQTKGTISGPDADTLLRWAVAALVAATVASVIEDALKPGRR